MRYYIEEQKKEALQMLQNTEDEELIECAYIFIRTVIEGRKKKNKKNTANTDQSESCILKTI